MWGRGGAFVSSLAYDDAGKSCFGTKPACIHMNLIDKDGWRQLICAELFLC